MGQNRVELYATVIGGESAAEAILESPASIGVESGEQRPPSDYTVQFIDYPFTKDTATFEDHLEVVRREQPALTVAPDIEKGRTLDDVVEQADILADHADDVVVVPKDIRPEEIPDRFRVGMPLANYGSDAPWEPADFIGVGGVHLLGGSPRVQHRVARTYVDVVSADGATPFKMAPLYEVWTSTNNWTDAPNTDLYDRISASYDNWHAALNGADVADDLPRQEDTGSTDSPQEFSKEWDAEQARRSGRGPPSCMTPGCSDPVEGTSDYCEDCRDAREFKDDLLEQERAILDDIDQLDSAEDETPNAATDGGAPNRMNTDGIYEKIEEYRNGEKRFVDITRDYGFNDVDEWLEMAAAENEGVVQRKALKAILKNDYGLNNTTANYLSKDYTTIEEIERAVVTTEDLTDLKGVGESAADDLRRTFGEDVSDGFGDPDPEPETDGGTAAGLGDADDLGADGWHLAEQTPGAYETDAGDRLEIRDTGYGYPVWFVDESGVENRLMFTQDRPTAESKLMQTVAEREVQNLRSEARTADKGTSVADLKPNDIRSEFGVKGKPAKILAKMYLSANELRDASRAELLSISGVGETTVDRIQGVEDSASGGSTGDIKVDDVDVEPSGITRDSDITEITGIGDSSELIGSGFDTVGEWWDGGCPFFGISGRWQYDAMDQLLGADFVDESDPQDLLRVFGGFTNGLYYDANGNKVGNLPSALFGGVDWDEVAWSWYTTRLRDGKRRPDEVDEAEVDAAQAALNTGEGIPRRTINDVDSLTDLQSATGYEVTESATNTVGQFTTSRNDSADIAPATVEFLSNLFATDFTDDENVEEYVEVAVQTEPSEHKTSEYVAVFHHPGGEAHAMIQGQYHVSLPEFYVEEGDTYDPTIEWAEQEAERLREENTAFVDEMREAPDEERMGLPFDPAPKGQLDAAAGVSALSEDQPHPVDQERQNVREQEEEGVLPAVFGDDGGDDTLADYEPPYHVGHLYRQSLGLGSGTLVYDTLGGGPKYKLTYDGNNGKMWLRRETHRTQVGGHARNKTTVVYPSDSEGPSEDDGIDVDGTRDAIKTAVEWLGENVAEFEVPTEVNGWEKIGGIPSIEYRNPDGTALVVLESAADGFNAQYQPDEGDVDRLASGVETREEALDAAIEFMEETDPRGAGLRTDLDIEPEYAGFERTKAGMGRIAKWEHPTGFYVTVSKDTTVPVHRAFEVKTSDGSVKQSLGPDEVPEWVQKFANRIRAKYPDEFDDGEGDDDVDVDDPTDTVTLSRGDIEREVPANVNGWEWTEPKTDADPTTTDIGHTATTAARWERDDEVLWVKGRGTNVRGFYTPTGNRDDRFTFAGPVGLGEVLRKTEDALAGEVDQLKDADATHREDLYRDGDLNRPAEDDPDPLFAVVSVEHGTAGYMEPFDSREEAEDRVMALGVDQYEIQYDAGGSMEERDLLSGTARGRREDLESRGVDELWEYTNIHHEQDEVVWTKPDPDRQQQARLRVVYQPQANEWRAEHTRGEWDSAGSELARGDFEEALSAVVKYAKESESDADSDDMSVSVEPVGNYEVETNEENNVEWWGHMGGTPPATISRDYYRTYVRCVNHGGQYEHKWTVRVKWDDGEAEKTSTFRTFKRRTTDGPEDPKERNRRLAIERAVEWMEENPAEATAPESAPPEAKDPVEAGIPDEPPEMGQFVHIDGTSSGGVSGYTTRVDGDEFILDVAGSKTTVDLVDEVYETGGTTHDLGAVEYVDDYAEDFEPDPVTGGDPTPDGEDDLSDALVAKGINRVTANHLADDHDDMSDVRESVRQADDVTDLKGVGDASKSEVVDALGGTPKAEDAPNSRVAKLRRRGDDGDDGDDQAEEYAAALRSDADDEEHLTVMVENPDPQSFDDPEAARRAYDLLAEDLGVEYRDGPLADDDGDDGDDIPERDPEPPTPPKTEAMGDVQGDPDAMPDPPRGMSDDEPEETSSDSSDDELPRQSRQMLSVAWSQYKRMLAEYEEAREEMKDYVEAKDLGEEGAAEINEVRRAHGQEPIDFDGTDPLAAEGVEGEILPEDIRHDFDWIPPEAYNDDGPGSGGVYDPSGEFAAGDD